MTSAGEQMGKRELAHLLGGDFDKLLVAVAECRTPKSGHAFDIGLALGVVDVNAVRALDDERPTLTKAGEIDVGMHQRFDVAGGKIAQRRHGILACRLRALFVALRWALTSLWTGKAEVTSSSEICWARPECYEDQRGYTVILTQIFLRRGC